MYILLQDNCLSARRSAQWIVVDQR